MPRQNRPVVRDGRIQAPPPTKKRTDRSYLQPSTAIDEPASIEETPLAEGEAETMSGDATVVLAADPTAAFAAPAAPSAPKAPAPAAPVRQAGVVRALQQQGIRKRRDVDLDALARRDTSYAIHELRRIGILTAMVVVTLVVLTIVLR